ncbi:hypothetical protein [Neorhizobium sp. NCHU2750]|uniref:hypothetical protein n=1 Tax=Neorhizobium sp. NCHU2750 TaxID=1825976 RepID=UPI000E747FE0|nr:hypothetical protein NCHU2750_50160 [Neorhizobium sp. NCHU2750]
MKLLADCGGLVRRIALAIPATFFDRINQPGDWAPLAPIGNLLDSMPNGIEAILLVDRIVMAHAERWVAGLTTVCDVTVCPVSDAAHPISIPWLQDVFHVRELSSVSGAGHEYLSFSGAGAAMDLATLQGAASKILPFHLDGGNQLIGSDFRIIGHSDFGKMEAIRALDKRPVHVFGYRVNDIVRPPAGLKGMPEADHHDLASGMRQHSKMHQFGYHVDQFVTLTGLERVGKPLLVVGEPVADGRFSRAIDVARCSLDASVIFLEEQGFEVIRNQVPFAVTTDTRKLLPRLYNNAMLENDLREGKDRPLIWLPQFSDSEALDETDQSNATLWEDLGFEVRKVFGWSHLASRSGALRCISKVIERCARQGKLNAKV